MKLLRSALVAGIAKKVIDEARKPHNQAKIKAYVAQAMDKNKNKGARGGTTGGRPY
jgi:flagellar biosynthesis/type III secretory pathway protein FliH